MRAFLHFARGDAAEAQTVERPLIVGRAPDCDLRFDDPHLSRRHVRIAPSQHGVHVTDLGSRNGMRINGRRVQDASLGDGDVVRIGSTYLRCRVATDTASRRRHAEDETNRVTSGSSQTTRVSPGLAGRPHGRDYEAAHAGQALSGHAFAGPAERHARALWRTIHTALAPERNCFASDRRFVRAWRWSIVAGWLALTTALFVLPAWIWVTADGDPAQAAGRAAGWLATQAATASVGADLDAVTRHARDLTGIDGVHVLDAACGVLSSSTRSGRRPPPVTCVHGAPAPTADGDAPASVHITRLATVVPTGATWVVAEPGVHRRGTAAFLGLMLASLAVMAVVISMATGRLLEALVAPVNRLAVAVSAALDGPGHLDASYALPALNRIAQVVELLLAQRADAAAPEPGGRRPARARYARADRQPGPQDTGSSAAAAVAREPASPAHVVSHATLIVTGRFVVHCAEGDLAAFGLTAVVPGHHVLDIAREDPGMANALLALLGSADRSDGIVTRAAVSVGASNRAVTLAASARGALTAIRITFEDDETTSDE